MHKKMQPLNIQTKICLKFRETKQIQLTKINKSREKLSNKIKTFDLTLQVKIFLYTTYVSVCALSHFSHVQLWDLVDCSPPDSSAHGIFQARTLEWVAIFYARGSSQLRDQTCISCTSCIGRQFLYHGAIWEALHH